MSESNDHYNNKPTIFCYAASDRYNYGDLLFPIVAEHMLESMGPVNFINAAVIDSDLSTVGALPTVGYDYLIDDEKQVKGATILIAGGQVMNTDWMQLLSYIKERWFTSYTRFNSQRFKRRILTQFNLIKEPYPFVPSGKRLLENNQVIYHAVGGAVPKIPHRKHAVAAALKQSPYVSVREKHTQRVTKNGMGIDTKLVPDSVMVYSDIMPKASLNRPVPQPYICVQFGYQKSLQHLDVILEQLTILSKDTGLLIGLLSIGNCPGHDDDKTSDWIIEHAQFNVTKLAHEHIDNVTAAIAHAEIFIGTSLHGAIVSMTYANRFVAVNKAINKLDAYTQTWAQPSMRGCVDYENIAQAAKTRLASHIDYSENVERQKIRVRESFKTIYDLALNYK